MKKMFIALCIILCFITTGCGYSSKIHDEKNIKKNALLYLEQKYSDREGAFFIEKYVRRADGLFLESELHYVTVYSSYYEAEFKVDIVFNEETNEYEYKDDYYTLYLKEDTISYYSNIFKKETDADRFVTKVKFGDGTTSSYIRNVSDLRWIDLYFYFHKDVPESDMVSFCESIKTDGYCGIVDFHNVKNCPTYDLEFYNILSLEQIYDYFSRDDIWYSGLEEWSSGVISSDKEISIQKDIGD